MAAKYVADFPLKYIQLISRRDRKILIQKISMHIVNMNTLYKMIWLISSCDYVFWIKIHGKHRLVLLIQAHGKYHMTYRISIKMYRYIYRIDQTDRYAGLPRRHQGPTLANTSITNICITWNIPAEYLQLRISIWHTQEVSANIRKFNPFNKIYPVYKDKINSK